MNFDFRDLITIVGVVSSAIVTFLGTKHSLKEYVRDKVEILKDKVHLQEIEIEKLKGRDENQQQIIKTFQNQVLDHLPKIYEIINSQKTKQL